MISAEWMLTEVEIELAKREGERLSRTHKVHPRFEKEKFLLQEQARKIAEWLNEGCPHRKPDQLSWYRYECPECRQALHKEVLGE